MKEVKYALLHFVCAVASEKQHSFSPSYEQLESSDFCEGYGMTRQSDFMICLHIALRLKG